MTQSLVLVVGDPKDVLAIAPDIDDVLGYDFLHTLLVTIDYPKRQLTLDSTVRTEVIETRRRRNANATSDSTLKNGAPLTEQPPSTTIRDAPPS